VTMSYYWSATLLQVWKSENNSDAVVEAAEKAASAVVEAAVSTSVSR